MNWFTAKKWETALELLLDLSKNGVLYYLWETFYVTVLATAFAMLLGLPLGILLVTGDEKGVLPLPKIVLRALNALINLLRSVPFLILMILVVPLTRLIVGKSYGSVASIVPLVVAAFPFVARLVESSLREVNPNIIEMAQSMGASPLQIICKVMLPESVPSLINNAAIAITTILGYSAMGGAIGAGGLGKLAIMYGYNKYNYPVMILAVIVLLVLVQLFQSIDTRPSVKLDKRIRKEQKEKPADWKNSDQPVLLWHVKRMLYPLYQPQRGLGVQGQIGDFAAHQPIIGGGADHGGIVAAQL